MASHSGQHQQRGRVDIDTTISYLRGDMPFEEYSALLERLGDESEQTDANMEVDIGLNAEVKTAAVEKETAELDLADDGDEDDDDDEEEGKMEPGFVEQQASASPAKGRPKGKTRNNMPKHLQGLMGEANLQFACGSVDEAIKMCMEIIRQVPHVSQPFQTLSTIYETRNDKEKAYQYGMIAAHLTRFDADVWLKMAGMALELNKLDDVVMCYNKAAKVAPKRADIQQLRAQYFAKTGDKKREMEAYEMLLGALGEDEGPAYAHITAMLARHHHENGDIPKAIVIMERAFHHHFSSLHDADVNLLLDLYFYQKLYTKSLQVLVDNCGVRLHYADNITPPTTIPDPAESCDAPRPIRCTVPQYVDKQFPVDLRAKLAVCLIRLKYHTCHQEVLRPLVSVDPNQVGDLHLDVAEALMDVGLYAEARPILDGLVHSHEYNKAAVWLRYAQCLASDADNESAIDAYYSVIRLAPGDLGARLSLSALLKQCGRRDEALRMLRHDTYDEDGAPFWDLQLLSATCGMLETEGRLKDMVECIRNILCGFMTEDYMQHVLDAHGRAQVNLKSIRETQTAFKGFAGRFATYKKSMQVSKLSIDDLWNLFVKACHLLADWGEVQQLKQLCYLARGHPLIGEDKAKVDDLNVMCATACIMDGDRQNGYVFAKNVCLKNMDNKRAWNLLHQAMMQKYDVRLHKSTIRLLNRNPNHSVLSLFHGHNCFMSASYKLALGEYVNLLRREPDNALLCLLIGLIYIHMACQRFSTRRHLLVIQGCSFLNQYVQLRGECQETFYNLGRAMHQLGLLYIAIFYYEKALALEPVISGPEQATFDLRREIAYNLIAIYKRSGSTNMVAYLVQKYLVI